MTDLDIEAIANRRADYESTVDDIDALVGEVERLRERLTAAETVCSIFGWTSLSDGSRMSNALAQAYMDWANTYGPPKYEPEWDSRIYDLAEKRAETRARTLAKIRAEVAP